MHIEIEGLVKRFGPLTVLDGCALSIDRGEVVSLLGPSGCGKTTLLRSIAGFIEPEQGSIRIGGVEVTNTPPHRRRVGLVFQNYALFPHLNVLGNVAYGLKVRRTPTDDVRQRVADALEMVSLSDLGDRYPVQLSGGQQQRVAIARALVLEPEVLLLDEPFNALDAKLRGSMQVELRKLVKRLGMTSIFVTHDQTEALTLSDRIAVMRSGTIEQVGDPLAVYDAPSSDYVAGFVGTANLIVRQATGGFVTVAGLRIDSPFEGPVRLVVRPENIDISAAAQSDWPGTVVFTRALGPTIEYEVDGGADGALRVLAFRRPGERPFAPGERVGLAIRDMGACHVLPGEAAP